MNSKYIKTKRNQKSEAKFFRPFRVLYPVRKQAYKLELFKKWRVHDVFHVSLLEQDTTRKGQVDKEVRQMKFDADNNNSREYEVKAIRDSAVSTRESESGHLPGLYYLISWKRYPKEENTWEPISAVEHLISSSARSTKIILTSQPRLLLLLTPHHRWLDRQSRPCSLPNESEDNQVTAPINELKRTELRLIVIVFLDKFGYLTHSTSSAALHMTSRDCT